MSFQFENIQAFLWMEGHGPYVWAAYAITFAGLAGLALKARMDRKSFVKRQAPLARSKTKA